MWNDPKYTLRQQVAKLVLIELGGRLGNLWNLAGPNRAGARQAILSLIRGKKVPRAKSGFNNTAGSLFNFFGAVGTCEAGREHSLFQIIALESEMKTD